MKENANVYTSHVIGTLHDTTDTAHESKTRHTLSKVMMKDKKGEKNGASHICTRKDTARRFFKKSDCHTIYCSIYLF